MNPDRTDMNSISSYDNSTGRSALTVLRSVRVSNRGAEVDGELISGADVTGLYREFIGDYPKFFKMGALCKLGFVAAELLLINIPPDRLEDAAIVLFNRNGSLVTDRNYQKTIGDTDYFPSPALFVYTLANIVTGEIAIRHKIYGESSFYVADSYDRDEVLERAAECYLTSSPSMIITGWVDWNDSGDYLAELQLVTKLY